MTQEENSWEIRPESTMLDSIGEIAVACPVCGSGDPHALCEVNGYAIRSCPVCLSDFVWPMPNDATLQANYDSAAYFTGGESPTGYSDYDSQTENVLPFFRDLLDRLGPGDGRSVLDVGCAYGTHLALAARAGWQGRGVEISEYARRVMQARHGDAIPVVASISDLPSRAWDLILLFDVIEHLQDPYRLFIDLAEKGALGPHTRVVVTTPNARSTEALAEPAGWAYRTPPEHLVFFSAESLALFFSTLGFARVDVLGLYRSSRPDASADASDAGERFLRPYSGLSCEASEFHASKPLSEKVLTERERIRETAVQLHTSPFIGAMFRAIARQSHLRYMEAMAAMNARARALDVLSTKLETERAEVEAFQRGHLYRLVHTLRGEGPLGERLGQSSWLIGSMLLPQSIKRCVLPLLRRAQLCADGTSGLLAPEPYAVRQPSALHADRPRVVHAIANFMTGGSARLVVDLIEQMGGEYEQEVITSFLPSPPAYLGLTISEFRYLDSPKPLLAYLSKFRPQLLHVHYWGDVDLHWYRQVFEAGRRYGCAIVENINTPVAPFVADSVRRYVFVSEYVQREFGRSVPHGEVIHPGSNMELFSRVPGVQPADDCIGMVYRLERDKLNDRAIDVFIEAVRRRPGTRVLIVGGGILQTHFQRAVSEAGLDAAFEFTGYVRYEDLPGLYARMGVFVAPVWKESFGQVSPFAMSMGLPVVGYNVGALAEIIADRELLAPPGDSGALAAIIARLLDDRDRRVEIGRANQRRAHEMFNVETMIRRYRQLYRELMNASP